MKKILPLLLSLVSIGSIGGRTQTQGIRSSGPSGVLHDRSLEGTTSLAQRIERVENGLFPGLVVKGGSTPTTQVAARMRYYKVPGVSVAVIDNGVIDWARGYGVREVGAAQLVSVETLFQAASISKPVTAMAALHFVEEGKLELDEDANRRLVSWRVPENGYTKDKKVTLRLILSHSAGLTVHGFAGYTSDEPVPTLLEVLDGKKPANSDPIRVDFVPGSKSRYSGGGYCVLQQMLMDITGESFPGIMQKTVLGRLGMKHSTFEQPLPQALAASAATGHGVEGQAIKGKWYTYPEMAPAGLWTTPSDLALFVIELLKSRAGKSNKVLSPEMTRQMLTPQVEGIGLGIMTNGARQPSSPFSHGGGNEGFRCLLVGFADTGKGAVIMTNSDNGSDLIVEIIRSIGREYGWPPPE